MVHWDEKYTVGHILFSTVQCIEQDGIQHTQTTEIGLTRVSMMQILIPVSTEGFFLLVVNLPYKQVVEAVKEW